MWLEKKKVWEQRDKKRQRRKETNERKQTRAESQNNTSLPQEVIAPTRERKRSKDSLNYSGLKTTNNNHAQGTPML